ncbi:MAG TPA: lysylphosphatidylglycerol synthase transmembrane domain-containing protein [Acidimicrobiia bacterium]|nr:lysylphosphatidylglycerol synthase transmembrane domain-containing protein [Acidimicrobiia bacterium]
MAQGSATRRARIRLAIGLAIGGGAVYAVVSSAGGFADSFGALTEASPRWLALGALFEAASYVTLGLMLRQLVGDAIDRRTAIRLGLVVNGLGNILPAAPAEGVTLAGAELRRRDVDARRTWIALGLLQWMSIRTLFGIAALDALVVVAAANRRYPHHAPGRFIIVGAAIAILATLVGTAWLASRRRTMELAAILVGKFDRRGARRLIDRREQGARWYAEIHGALGSRRAHLDIVALAIASCLADATCFYCALKSVGVDLKPAQFVFAYAVGMIATLVPFVPNGLGIVETVVPALLHRAGVPIATALAGVLAFRALATVLPAAFGTAALLRLRLTPS